MNIFDREPVRIAAAVRAAVLCATAFGLQLSAEQIAAIMLVVETILAVVVREKVSPV